MREKNRVSEINKATNNSFKDRKASNLSGALLKLMKFSKAYVPAIIIALIAATIGTVFQIIGPDKIKELTNEIAKGFSVGIDLSAIYDIGMILVAYYLASALLSFLQSYIMATVTQRISKELRTGISEKINRLPFKYFDKVSYGDVLSRVTNDVDTIGQSLNRSIGTLVSSVTLLAGSVFMMFKTSWILALTAIFSSLTGFILMVVIMKKSQKYFVKQQEDLGKINGHIEEIYSNHNIVKVYNGEADANEKFEQINKDLFSSAWKSQFLSGMMMPVMGFVANFGYVAVCVVGATLTMKDIISFGVIVAFTLYVRLFTQPLNQIAQAANSLQQTGAAAERVFHFFDEEELPDESKSLKLPKDIKGDVEFRHVRFGYDKENPVIKDFNAEVRGGQKIAIVGPTGAGKTTLVNLLMRFYELDGGEIFIDEIPISSVSRENLHEQFCMVLQDTWIFEGTVNENIAYSSIAVRQEEVIKACRSVGLDSFIRTLPKGYETVLNNKISLSAGQKQLITIARAMIRNAPILILDEATSSVDTRTEVVIQKAMDRLMHDRTSFVIAHRLSTVKNADLIFVIKDGDIVESGNHEELLALDGSYAELYRSQFEPADVETVQQ